MREPTKEGEYEIQYATARVEAIMALSEAAMMLLLDGPDGRNAHVAWAIKLILDDHAGPLERRMNLLEEAVLKHHPDPDHRETPQSQPKFADRIKSLSKRYEQHMDRFPRNMKPTADSVFYTVTTMPAVINRALHHLNAEVITREPGDPVRRGYIAAMLDLASMIPVHEQKKALALSRNGGDANSSRKKRFMELAEAAARDTERLMGVHEMSSEEGK